MNIKRSQGFNLLTTILYAAAVFLIADKSFWLGMVLFAVATCFFAIAGQARNEEKQADRKEKAEDLKDEQHR